MKDNDFLTIPLLAMAALVETDWCTADEADAIWKLLRAMPANAVTVSGTAAVLRRLRATVRDEAMIRRYGF